MNNTFNFRRFFKIFTYDINKSIKNYGVTFIVLSMMPILSPLIYGVLSLCFSFEWNVPGLISRCAIFATGLAVLILSFAPSVYGKITDKRYGCEYLMIPASPFEKFLSMTIVTGIVIPFAFTLTYGLMDLLALGVSLSEGESLLAFFFNHRVLGNEGVAIRMDAIFILSTCLYSLIILLGSIYFKKFKVGKTLLVLFALSILMSWISIPVINMLVGNAQVLEEFALNVEEWILANTDKLEIYLNIFIDAVYIIEYAVLLTLLYLRVRKIKQ